MKTLLLLGLTTVPTLDVTNTNVPIDTSWQYTKQVLVSKLPMSGFSEDHILTAKSLSQDYALSFHCDASTGKVFANLQQNLSQPDINTGLVPMKVQFDKDSTYHLDGTDKVLVNTIESLYSVFENMYEHNTLTVSAGTQSPSFDLSTFKVSYDRWIIGCNNY